MAKTVTSGSTAYCTAAQMVARYDTRSLGQLLSDSNTVALTADEVLASTKLAAFLKEASGQVEAAALFGEKYTAADLAALSGTNGGETLAGLVADLTMWRIWDRRPDKNGPLPKRCEFAFAMLEQLRAGDRIFGFQQTVEAGRIDHEQTTADEARIRGGPSVILERYFGIRGDRDRRNQN